MKYQRIPQGIAYHPGYGRIMEHKGNGMRIYWSPQMLGYLSRHYSTTLNEELAGCLGVSMRTVIRKARELNLEKDPSWLAQIYEERRLMAQAEAKRRGYPGAFPKGKHSNPEGEFKPGHKMSQDAEMKRRESMRRWQRLHPDVARERGLKAWETRRNKQAENGC
jgi:hypothetical protein